MALSNQALIGIAFGILFGLVCGGLIGWFIAKIKMRKHLKKIDNEIHKPENVDKFIDLYKEQKQSEIEREDMQNGRRRKLLRGQSGSSGDPTQQLGDIKELINRKPEVKGTTQQPVSDGRNEESRKLQDTKPNEDRKDDWVY